MQTAKTDQTGRMPRLIWVFAGCTGIFVGFVMWWLIWSKRRKQKRSGLFRVFTVCQYMSVRKQDHYGKYQNKVLDWYNLYFLCIQHVPFKLHRFDDIWQETQMSGNVTKPTKSWRALGKDSDQRPVWSESAVCMKKPWVISFPSSAQQRLWSDCIQTAGRTCCFVGFVMLWLKYQWHILTKIWACRFGEMQLSVLKTNEFFENFRAGQSKAESGERPPVVTPRLSSLGKPSIFFWVL